MPLFLSQSNFILSWPFDSCLPHKPSRSSSLFSVFYQSLKPWSYYFVDNLKPWWYAYRVYIIYLPKKQLTDCVTRFSSLSSLNSRAIVFPGWIEVFLWTFAVPLFCRFIFLLWNMLWNFRCHPLILLSFK